MYSVSSSKFGHFGVINNIEKKERFINKVRDRGRGGKAVTESDRQRNTTGGEERGSERVLIFCRVKN